MSVSIDLPFGLSDLDKVFQITELLDNREELIKEFQPEVSKYLVKEGFFKGPFKKRYEEEFDNLIISLIRRQIVKHFTSFTPEEVVLLTDLDFLRMITSDFYFTQSNYLPKERENNEQH
jgi:hypothetical protein